MYDCKVSKVYTSIYLKFLFYILPFSIKLEYYQFLTKAFLGGIGSIGGRETAGALGTGGAGGGVVGMGAAAAKISKTIYWLKQRVFYSCYLNY